MSLSLLYKLDKDIIQYLFEYLNPLDWYNLALVSKKCKVMTNPHISRKYKNFIKVITNLHNKTPEVKLSFYCMRPLKKGNSLGCGCLGDISNGICSYHLLGNKMCVKCKFNEVDSRCFGDYCNSQNCKDYKWILWNGEAVLKRKYECSISGCKRSTDGKFCLTCSRQMKEASLLSQNIQKSIRCTAIKLDGNRCTKSTSLESHKCKIHTFNVNKIKFK